MPLPSSNAEDGASVLITGCSSGIGLCCALGLQQRGYRVFASARRAEDVERLRQLGLEALQLDLASSQSIQQAFAQVMAATHGQLYALFNNGAYGQPGAVEDLSRDTLRQQLETNLLGWHELSCLALGPMLAAGRGRLVHNSSVLGFVAMPYRGAYNCSKYALEGLTDTLRLELRGTGVHVSLIQPGPILSRFRENAYRSFQRNIDPAHSRHREQYAAMERRLTLQGPAAPFTLPPEAVLKRLIHALESPRPRARYPVTFPTYLFALLKRLLPTALLDRLLIKASGDGAR
jgi:NAD(P)-dependent dehydrogenase (short-subunit alcohol dehydrogenase family)